MYLLSSLSLGSDWDTNSSYNVANCTKKITLQNIAIETREIIQNVGEFQSKGSKFFYQFQLCFHPRLRVCHNEKNIEIPCIFSVFIGVIIKARCE